MKKHKRWRKILKAEGFRLSFGKYNKNLYMNNRYFTNLISCTDTKSFNSKYDKYKKFIDRINKSRFL